MTATTPRKPQRIFSGIQPTAQIHLGNYLGAVRHWTELQHQMESLFCVVDLHAVTMPQDAKMLRRQSRDLLASLLAAGIDPDHSTLFIQSHVGAYHCQLAWLLGCLTPVGWLNRMTQFKEKAGKNQEQASLGLYSYPVLMSADILLYHATHVPVGEDQKQHLELTREIAGAFNRRFDQEFFTLPEPQILGPATRVMSLRDGRKKMSKSDPSDYSRITFDDDADMIMRKIKKAKTDPKPLPDTPNGLEERAEAKNLVNLYAALSGTTAQKVLEEFGGEEFSVFKPQLAELIITSLMPIREKKQQWLNAPDDLEKIARQGAEKATEIAEKTLSNMRDMMGFFSLRDLNVT